MAVRIRLIDSVTGGLLGLSRQFHKAHGDADLLQSKLTRIGRTMAVGAGMTAAGIGIFAALKPALSEAERFQTELAKFTLFNMGDAANRDAVQFVKAMNVAGTSYVDNMARMTEAQGVFRDSAKLTRSQQLEAAKMATPMLAKIAYVADTMDGEHAGAEKASSLAMLRFIEQRGGLTSPQRFNAIAEAGFKAIRSSGGNVSWELLRQFIQNGGSATNGLTDEALFAKFEPIIGEMKGRAGTAYMTAYNRLSGAQPHLAKAVAHAFVDMGIWDAKKIVWNNQGGVKEILGGKGGLPGDPMKDSHLFGSDPFAFYDKYVRTRYDAMKIDMVERSRDNNILFGRTGGALFNLYEKQHSVVAKSVAVQAQQMGVGQSVAVARGTLKGQQIEASKAFRDALEQTGEAIIPIATKVMQTVLPALRFANAWMQAHPKLFSGLVSGLIAIGAALVFGGAITSAVAMAQAVGVLFTVFGTAGTAIGGLEGIGVAIGVLAGAVSWPVVAIAAAAAAIGLAVFQIWRHWDSTKSVWQNIRAEFTMFTNFLGGLAGRLWNGLPGWARAILQAGASVATGGIVPLPALGKRGPQTIPAAVRDFNAQEQAVMNGGSRKVDHPLIIHLPFTTPTDAHAAGQAVAKGVAQGVVAAHPAVRAATTGTAHQAVDAFKRATDQHSPSRVFAALGDMLIQGLIVGVERTAPGLLSRLGDLGRAAMGSMRGLSGAGGDFSQKLTSSVAERASQAMAFFRAHGWSGAQAAGLVSNMIRESGLNNTAVNRHSGAYGAVQWLGSRVRDFQAFTGHALRGSSLLDQLRFTDHELRTTHASVGRALLAARTPGAAAALINGRFEINGVAGEGGRRAALASQLATMRFGDMAPTQSTRSPYVRHGSTVVEVHHKTTLDGRVLTETVTRHQAHDASRPHVGVSTFDPTMSAAPVGLGYHP